MADQIKSLIEQAALRHGLDPRIFEAQIRQESQFNPNAYNKRSGAAGIAQIMEATARDPGYGVDPIMPGDRYDPVKALEFSAQYQRAMLDEFGGDQAKALKAYNWGPGNVRKWLANGGDPSRLPAETRDYVKKITGGEMAYSNSPIERVNTMTGERRTIPGRGVSPLQFAEAPIERANRAPRVTAERRDNVELAPPKEDMGFLEGFLTSQGGLLNRIGGGMAAENGRHPTQLAMRQEQRLEDQMAGKMSQDPTERFAYAMKLGADPQLSMEFAQTGDISILGGIDPNAGQKETSYGYQMGDRGVMPDGRPGVIRFNRDTGQPELVPVEGADGGFTRYQDTGQDKFAELDAKKQQDFASSANEASSRISNLTVLESKLDSGAFGPQAAKALGRWLASNLNIDGANYTAADIDVINQIAASMNLDAAKLIAGQGAVTDFERNLLKQTIVSIETDPRAARQIINTMKNAAQRERRMYDAWLRASPDQKSQGLDAFKYRFLQEETDKQYEDYVETLAPGTEFTGPDGKKYRK